MPGRLSTSFLHRGVDAARLRRTTCGRCCGKSGDEQEFPGSTCARTRWGLHKNPRLPVATPRGAPSWRWSEGKRNTSPRRPGATPVSRGRPLGDEGVDTRSTSREGSAPDRPESKIAPDEGSPRRGRIGSGASVDWQSVGSPLPTDGPAHATGAAAPPPTTPGLTHRGSSLSPGAARPGTTHLARADARWPIG